jgi:transposase
MPKAKNPNKLGFTSSDRRRLIRDKRIFQRLRALYLVATGYPIGEVACVIGVSRQSLYNWINSYLATHQAESLFDAARTGWPSLAQKKSLGMTETNQLPIVKSTVV